MNVRRVIQSNAGDGTLKEDLGLSLFCALYAVYDMNGDVEVTFSDELREDDKNTMPFYFVRTYSDCVFWQYETGDKWHRVSDVVKGIIQSMVPRPDNFIVSHKIHISVKILDWE